jgi:glycine cleavage system pyridoxal-binding protein P
VNYYSWLQDYLARLDGKEARREYYERYYASWHEVARKMAEAIAESQAMLASVSTETQLRQAQLTQSFFDSVLVNLNTQTRSNLAASRELAEQALRSQEATQTLVQESVSAYVDFLDSMLSYYRTDMKVDGRSVEN